MKPLQHLILGIIFALVLLVLFPSIDLIGFFLIIASTVLIDVDHYTYYIYKTKNFNLKKSFNWYLKDSKKYLSLSRKEKDKYYTGFCFLHGVEILIILFLLGKFVSVYFYYVLIGFVFHLSLDFIEQIKQNKRIDKLSIIYDIIKFRKLKLFQEENE